MLIFKIHRDFPDQVLEALRDKPFWFWDVESHRLEDARTSGNCCFNHIIGLPKKSGLEKPLFDYERTVIDILSSTRHLWIKKATGLGISELLLRYMSWLCVKDDSLSGSQMCIVTGPRIDLAITLIDRMKDLFVDRASLEFDKRNGP